MYSWSLSSRAVEVEESRGESSRLPSHVSVPAPAAALTVLLCSLENLVPGIKPETAGFWEPWGSVSWVGAVKDAGQIQSLGLSV